MNNLGVTPKKQNQAEKQPLIVLNTDIQIINGLKKYKKRLKKYKNNTAYIISKKIKPFSKRSKPEKQNKLKNDNEILKNNINNNNFRIFLFYKLKKKYDSLIYTYNVKKINELIFNIPSKFTANFKDYLLIEEDAEFLKREYHKEEFNKKFKKIFFFYEKYSKTFPNYTLLNEGKYMYKNILKKQKMIDELQKIKEEEEEKTNSKFMEISNETIFTSNTIESINNIRDSFWINKLQEIINLDKSIDEKNLIEKINIIINIINKYEKLKEEKSNKQAIYKKEFEKIRNLSKPLYINQINPRLMQIKEKINQIKKCRNNFELIKKSKNNKTIESSYNSYSTSINNKSFNNKGIIINNNIMNITNLYEDKKDVVKKRIPCPKDLSYKKGSKEKDLERDKLERLSNLSHKFQKNNIQDESKFSNSMITNKIKNYFKININGYEKKKNILNNNTQKKNEYSYNIGSLFNSRKDRCKEFSTEKKLISVFNKYITNKTKPFKKNSYLNTESINSQTSQHSHIRNENIINSQYNLNPKTYNTFNTYNNNNNEFYFLKNSYDDNIIKQKKKNSNFTLTKKSFINNMHYSFLNNTISCLRKNKKNSIIKNNKKYSVNNNRENFNKNKIYLRSKILKNYKNKSNKKKRMSFLNINNNNRYNYIKNKMKINSGEKNYLKTSFFIRSNTNNSINNTNISIENQSVICNKKKKKIYGKKINLPGIHNCSGRNDKFTYNLKFACGRTFHSNKSSTSKNEIWNKY